jgi:hypothetical protein
MGMSMAGLWRVDVASGSVTALLQSDFDSNPLDAADNPFLAPDGQLYYFHASCAEHGRFYDPRTTATCPFGCGRRDRQDRPAPRDFERMTEALWAPDASFVIVCQRPERPDLSGRRGAVVLH